MSSGKRNNSLLEPASCGIFADICSGASENCGGARDVARGPSGNSFAEAALHRVPAPWHAGFRPLFKAGPGSLLAVPEPGSDFYVGGAARSVQYSRPHDASPLSSSEPKVKNGDPSANFLFPMFIC